MKPNGPERTVLDVIREHSDNREKDLSVVDLAERAFRAAGLTITLSDEEIVFSATKSPTLATKSPDWKGMLVFLDALQSRIRVIRER